MPSSEKGLDSRRLKDVKPRDLAAEDYSLDNFKHRVQHRRLADLLGEEEAVASERRLYDWRKEWGKQMTHPATNPASAGGNPVSHSRGGT